MKTLTSTELGYKIGYSRPMVVALAKGGFISRSCVRKTRGGTSYKQLRFCDNEVLRRWVTRMQPGTEYRKAVAKRLADERRSNTRDTEWKKRRLLARRRERRDYGWFPRVHLAARYLQVAIDLETPVEEWSVKRLRTILQQLKVWADFHDRVVATLEAKER